jgi:hypothetical protein
MPPGCIHQKKYLVYTVDEAKLIVENDDRYREPDVHKRNSAVSDAAS